MQMSLLIMWKRNVRLAEIRQTKAGYGLWKIINDNLTHQSICYLFYSEYLFKFVERWTRLTVVAYILLIILPIIGAETVLHNVLAAGKVQLKYYVFLYID
jgi:hypothetical protein